MHSASPRDEQEKYLRLSQYTPKLDNLLKKLFYDTLITYVLICTLHDGYTRHAGFGGALFTE
jgi:hypothetical protein